MPLVLTVTDTDLWNQAPYPSELSLSPRAPTPLESLHGFRQLVSFSASRTERGFHAVPHAINRALAPVVAELIDAPRMLRAGESAALARLCERLCGCLRESTALLGSIYAEVEPAEFWEVYRLFLGGWQGAGLHLPAAPPARAADGAADAGGGEGALPELVVWHGGPSAGQTAELILVDLVLGLRHGAQLAAFQAEMRSYLPAAHTRLLADVEAAIAASGTTLPAVAAAATAGPLNAAYGRACGALASMRAAHLGVATRYLSKALQGTGGSDFRSLLREGLTCTRQAAAGGRVPGGGSGPSEPSS